MFGVLPIENVWLYPENSSFSILGLLPPQDVRQKMVVSTKQINVKRPIPSFFIVSSFFINYFFQNTKSDIYYKRVLQMTPNLIKADHIHPF